MEAGRRVVKSIAVATVENRKKSRRGRPWCSHIARWHKQLRLTGRERERGPAGTVPGVATVADTHARRVSFACGFVRRQRNWRAPVSFGARRQHSSKIVVLSCFFFPFHLCCQPMHETKQRLLHEFSIHNSTSSTRCSSCFFLLLSKTTVVGSSQSER